MDRTTTDTRPTDTRPTDTRPADTRPTDDRPAESRSTDDRLLTTEDLARGTGRPADDGRSTVDARATPDDARDQLFEPDRADGFRSRWESVQASFVDEPRQAVEQADGLVAEIMKELAKTFADERRSLEKQWTLGDDVSTEDLRQALRHYRSFFDRLLSL